MIINIDNYPHLSSLTLSFIDFDHYIIHGLIMMINIIDHSLIDMLMTLLITLLLVTLMLLIISNNNVYI